MQTKDFPLNFLGLLLVSLAFLAFLAVDYSKTKSRNLFRDFGFSERKMIAHLRFDRAFPGAFALGGSKQDSRGAPLRLLTVAAFRPWRGSQREVARGPLINAPFRGLPHKRGPGRGNSVLLMRIADSGHRKLPT